MIKSSLFFLIISTTVFAADKPDPCQLFEYCRGTGAKRSYQSSSPSPVSSASFNPSNLSSLRGVGVEAIYQPGNSVLFDLASGNGKIGALISPNLENSFFGNRGIELDQDYFKRRETREQYKNKKISFASGLKFIDKKIFSVDLGISAKYNEDLRALNPGYGASVNLGPLRLGYYRYKDDIKVKFQDNIDLKTGIPYTFLYNAPDYEEKFWVETLTAGLRIKSFTFDAGVIKTRYQFYDENTRIYLHSASYNWHSLLFLGALRKEYSPNFYYQNGQLIEQRKKEDAYYGLQWLANRHIILGANYNFFLLKELSGTLIILF